MNKKPKIVWDVDDGHDLTVPFKPIFSLTDECACVFCKDYRIKDKINNLQSDETV